MAAKDNRPLDESSAPRWTGTVTNAPPAPAREATLADGRAGPGGGATEGIGGGATEVGGPGGGFLRGTARAEAPPSGATGMNARMLERTDIDPRRDAFPGYRLRPGMRFGPCTTVSPLGRGGMGEVWLAVNDAEQRDEAVKVLLDANARDDEMRRFIREAQASMSLSGAREVVRTYAVDVEQGLLYIRMELVRGKPLDAWTPKDGPELFAVMKRMASALAVGHRKRLVHRDVKPSNYMVRDDGTVKLMDFGLARPLGVTTLTATSAMMGTPAYMSPEQWLDARSVDMRADVYSLGVAFYALLARRLPYDSGSCATPQAYHLKVVSEDPPPPAPLEGMPRQTGSLILRAMAKRPEERYADAVELLHALERIERDPGLRVEAPASEASRRRVASMKRIAAFAAALVFTIGGTAAGVSWAFGRGRAEAPPSPFAPPGGTQQQAQAGPSAADAQAALERARLSYGHFGFEPGAKPAGEAPSEAASSPGAVAASVASSSSSAAPASGGGSTPPAPLDREAVRRAALEGPVAAFLRQARDAEAKGPALRPEALRAYQGAIGVLLMLSPEELAITEEALGVTLADVRARAKALRDVAVGDAIERESAAKARPVPASTGEFSPPPGRGPSAGGAGAPPQGDEQRPPPPMGGAPGEGRPPPPPPPGGGRGGPPGGGGRGPR